MLLDARIAKQQSFRANSDPEGHPHWAFTPTLSTHCEVRLRGTFVRLTLYLNHR